MRKSWGVLGVSSTDENVLWTCSSFKQQAVPAAVLSNRHSFSLLSLSRIPMIVLRKVSEEVLAKTQLGIRVKWQ